MRKQNFKVKTGSNKRQPKGYYTWWHRLWTQEVGESANTTKSANITATKTHNKNPGYLHFYVNSQFQEHSVLHLDF